MRAKDFWEIFPLPAKIKLFWDRITLTKTTTIYFVFSVLHCILQVIFQVQAHRISVQAIDFLVSIVEQGNAVASDAFYVFGDDLRLCDEIPTSFSTNSCQVIWDGLIGNNTLVSTSVEAAAVVNATIVPSHTATMNSIHITSTISMTSSAAAATMGQPTMTSFSTGAESAQTLYPSSTPARTPTEDRHKGDWDAGTVNKAAVFRRSFPSMIEAVNINGTARVVINGFGWENQSAILDESCAWALGWPVQILRNTKREDLTFIMFQIWVLGMSIVAILNESVPHMIASLLTHLVATGWAGFQMFNTTQFRDQFTEVTTNGACHPIDLLPTYWQSRAASEIPSLVMNAVALLISALLSWRLAKAFGWQTFKRVGASLTISHVYRTVLSLSIVIQLSLFFIVTSIALWLDQLCNGAIGQMATSPVYRPALAVTLVLLPPWLALGWYSVRRERRTDTFIFLFMCVGYLAGWGTMFNSPAFRWTYVTWTFFGVMTTISVALTSISFVLGIMCRLNFGKGLSQCLNVQEPISGFEPVTADDPEKRAAYRLSNGPALPVTFGTETSVPSGFLPQIVTKKPGQGWLVKMINQTSLQRPSPAKTAPERTSGTVKRHPSQNSVDSSMSGASTRSDKKDWIIE